MNVRGGVLALGILLLTAAPAGWGVVALASVQGVVQSVDARTGTIVVAGRAYPLGRDAVVSGAAGLRQIRPGSKVSVLLAPGGKRVLRITVLPGRFQPHAGQ